MEILETLKQNYVNSPKNLVLSLLSQLLVYGFVQHLAHVKAEKSLFDQ